jgi:hypothetical protein
MTTSDDKRPKKHQMTTKITTCMTNPGLPFPAICRKYFQPGTAPYLENIII